MVCGRPIGVVCFGDQGVPLGDPCFPQWGEVFEEFVRVMDGLIGIVVGLSCRIPWCPLCIGCCVVFGVGFRLWLARLVVRMWQWHCPLQGVGGCLDVGL